MIRFKPTAGASSTTIIRSRRQTSSRRRWRSRDNNGDSQSYSNPLSSANSITTLWQYGYGGALVQSTDANGVSTTFNINRCGYTGSDQATYYSMPGQVSRAVGTTLERSTIQNWDC